MSTRLDILDVFGELNSLAMNSIEVDGVTGNALLTLGLIDDGEAWPWIVIVNFPKIRPRICVPQETRDVKPRC